MNVAELIDILNNMPKDAIVCVNDENGGNFFEGIDVSLFKNEVIIHVNND